MGIIGKLFVGHLSWSMDWRDSTELSASVLGVQLQQWWRLGKPVELLAERREGNK